MLPECVRLHERDCRNHGGRQSARDDPPKRGEVGNRDRAGEHTDQRRSSRRVAKGQVTRGPTEPELQRMRDDQSRRVFDLARQNPPLLPAGILPLRAIVGGRAIQQRGGEKYQYPDAPNAQSGTAQVDSFRRSRTRAEPHARLLAGVLHLPNLGVGRLLNARGGGGVWPGGCDDPLLHILPSREFKRRRRHQVSIIARRDSLHFIRRNLVACDRQRL